MDEPSKPSRPAGQRPAGPRWAVSAIAGTAVLVAAALALLVPVARLSGAPAQPTAPPATPTPGPRQSPCWITTTKSASPHAVLLGDTVSVTLVTRHLCPGERPPMHVVLVLDGSASMAGAPRQRMRTAALEVLRFLDIESYPRTSVGVVSFGSGAAAQLCRMGSTEAQLRTCIERVGAEGTATAAPGLREAARMLAQAMREPGSEADEVVVVFSAGALDDCGEVVAAARTAKGRGAEIAAVCVGDGCAASCLRDVASSPARYLSDRPSQPLLAFLGDVRDRLRNVNIARLELRDELGPDVEFVPASASPRQSEPDLPTTWLAWTLLAEIDRVITVTYRVRPTRTGQVPANTRATGHLVDTADRDRSWTFPPAWVTVLGAPSAPPAATASATPTGTPRPSETPTATATATAPRLETLYLPYALAPEAP